MPTLYVIEPGARVEKEYGSLIVTSEESEVIFSAPLSQVSEVVLARSAGVTSPALWALLENGVGLSLVNRGGRLVGRLQPAQARNLDLRRRHYACASDPDFCHAISRAIILGKLHNSRILLRRILRQDSQADNPALQQAGGAALLAIRRAQASLPAAADLASLRGLEGSASRAYFAALRKALRPELSFERRQRRPPPDPANALLSLAYALLTNACFTACQLVGLDPYDGFYHADKYGRPSLALDLVEEFRALLGDALVLALVNKRILQADDFEDARQDGKPAVYLTQAGMRKFIHQFERRLNSQVFHPDAGRRISYQKILEIQARRLRRSIEKNIPDYTAFHGR